MQKIEDKGNFLQNALKLFFGDSIVLYIVVIMMSIMYHYRSSLTLVFGLASLVICVLIFRLFDYIAKHKLIGSAAYIALFLLFVFAAKYCVDAGSLEYPISFGIWFLTPQDALDYSRWYTLAMFLFFMMFITSVVYYFTKVRYRVFMNCLIFIIPFVIYGKEYEKMPTIFIMLLSVGYVTTMIKCRKLNDGDNVVIQDRKPIIKSAAIYTLIFILAAAVVPKPKIEANRDMLEELISADQFTDKLLAALNVFRDNTSGDQFRSLTDDVIVYFVRSDEDLRLKTVTFSKYDYDTDTWNVIDNDTRFKFTTEDRQIKFPETGELMDAIILAAKTDDEFSEKYKLEDLKSAEVNFPETKEITIYSVGQSAQFAPVPPLMTELLETTYEDAIAYIKSGLVYCKEGRFASDETFTYEYCSDTFFRDENNKLLFDTMSRNDYSDMIEEAAVSLEDEYPDASTILFNNQWQIFNTEENLNYGKNGRIYNLSQEITSGFDSDYDKAMAIVRYFSENDFVYDLQFNKKSGSNAENFLFESKRGVCYEYATSMVLLARAAGIPARYAEGYNMSEEYANERLGTNYVVKSKHAHGFPELYIRGVGWVSFEPTVSTLAPETSNTIATEKLSNAGIMLFVIALICLILYKLSPAIIHKLFLIKVKKASNNDSIIFVIRRISSLYNLSESLTSHEITAFVAEKNGLDINSTAKLFDKVAYGGQAASDFEKQKAVNEYILVYQTYTEQKKKKFRQKSEKTA